MKKRPPITLPWGCACRNGAFDVEDMAAALMALDLDNTVAPSTAYDTFDCLPSWAKATLDRHRGDRRPYVIPWRNWKGPARMTPAGTRRRRRWRSPAG